MLWRVGKLEERSSTAGMVTMSKQIEKTILTAFAGVFAVMVGMSGVRAQDSCATYGRLALKQMQENEQKKCGLKGPEWSMDLKAHVDWCATVSADQWKAQIQKREQALASCKKG